MRVCVFGLGAIGGLLAAALARCSGIELSGVARGAHLEAIRAGGLRIRREAGEEIVRLEASDDPASLGPQDVVFNCLKAHQSWESAGMLAALLGPGTFVVTCQNGVPWWYFHAIGGAHEGRRLASVDPGDRQWDALGPERAIGCSVYPAAEILEPGVIRHSFGDRFALGEPDGSISERVTSIASLLEAGGLVVPVLDDIRSEIWLKLWGNLCFNPISALTGASLDQVATDPGTRALAGRMMEEGRAVGEALGAGFRVSIERRIDGAARVTGHRTSMLQDLEAGRAMEIDAIVGAVVELGRITGIPTPTIEGVLALVCQLGRSRGTYPPDGGQELFLSARRNSQLLP